MALDINYVIFFVFGVLYLIGFTAGAYLLIIGAGILILGSYASITLFPTDWYNVVFCMLIGLFSIYHGVILIMQERKNVR